MRERKLLSLALAVVMTVSAFAGLMVTGASAAVGDAANNIWTASAADNGKTANTVLYDGDKGTLTTLFDLTEYTEYSAEEPVNETVGERTFTAYVSHPSMNGGFNNDGTLNTAKPALTLFSFVPKSDGVLTVYFLKCGSATGNPKYACIVKAGTQNYKTNSLVYQQGTGVSIGISAEVEANQTYYMFVDGSKGQFAAVDFEAGASYTQATEEPVELTNEWKMSVKDLAKKTNDKLMIGLTVLFDNVSTSNNYIKGASNGEGSALQYVAPDNGELTVDIYDLGAGKTVIATNSAGSTVAKVTNEDSAKALKTLVIPVVKDATYKIMGKDTTAQYSAAKFTAKSAEELTYSWTMSEADATKTTGTELMKGLTMQFDTDSTKTKYIIGADNGLGSALKYEAYTAGTLSVTFYQLGNTDSQKTAAIYDVTDAEDAAVVRAGVEKATQQTTGAGKEDITLTTAVVADHTYLIYSPDSKGSYSAASFTPSSGTQATDEPSGPETPSAAGITYADGTITVKTDKTAATGKLIHAIYSGTALSKVEVKNLTFTSKSADFAAANLTNALEVGSKLMAWDDVTTMEPLCAAKTITAEDLAPATAEPGTTTPEPGTATPEPGTATPEPGTTTPEPGTATPEPGTPEDDEDLPEAKVTLMVDSGATTNADEKTFKTVNEALAYAKTLNPASEADRVELDIVPGVYREQIQVDVPYITMRKKPGEDGEVKLTWYYGIGYQYYSVGSDGFYSKTAYDTNKTAGTVSATGVNRWGCATRINANDFYAKDITFENSFNRYVTDEEIADGVTAAPTGGVYTDTGNKPARTADSNVYNREFTERAAAIAVEKVDRIAFFNCKILSSQDTLYTGNGTGRQYYKDCTIEGQTDYIFGGTTIVFDNCNFDWTGYADTQAGGHLTATRNSDSDKGYLLYGGKVGTAAYRNGQYAQGDFGRPWGGADSPTAAIGVKIDNIANDTPAIIAKGWADWSTKGPDSQYVEYGTKGADGNEISLVGRNCVVPDEWGVLAYNPYAYLIRTTDTWDPMKVKTKWETVQAALAGVTIDTTQETVAAGEADDAYTVSGPFTLPADNSLSGYDIHFETDSDYVTIGDDNAVSVVRPISGTSTAKITAYARKTDEPLVGASKEITLTITADDSVDPTAFQAKMTEAKAAVAAVMGTATGDVYTLDRTVQIPTIEDSSDGVKTKITIETTGAVNADGTITRNAYGTDPATGKITYVIECQKGLSLLRDKVEYNVTIPQKKGDLLYADFEDGKTAVSGTLKAGGNNSGYYVEGAVNGTFANASSANPVTVLFDVKKPASGDVTATVNSYVKTIAATDLADGWNTVKLVIDTTAKTVKTTINDGEESDAEAVAAGETAVTSLALSNGSYDNIAVYEGVYNADGSIVTASLWKASSADKEKTPDQFYMRGLSPVITLNSGSGVNVTLDEETFTYYVSSGTNGNWETGGTASGTALKFVAPADGTWTVYVTNLGSSSTAKTLFMAPEGAVTGGKNTLLNNTAEANAAEGVVSVDGLGESKMLSITVEKGKAYYAWVQGSKGRFVGSKFVPSPSTGE